MPYLVTQTDGTNLTTIQDGKVDNTTALTLPGPNYVGYGAQLNENLVHLLENFAGNAAPAGTPLQGQLYFDKFNQVLKVYTTQGYVPVSGVTNAGIQPTLSKDGDLWFNTTTNQLSIWDNGQFKPVGPIYTKAQGVSGVVPVTVDDAVTTGLPHNILKLQFGNLVIATLSADASFVPSGLGTGFPRINPGITINSTIAGATINTNVVGNLIGNVQATTVSATTVTGNVVASTITGILTGNVVGNLTGNTVGVHTGNVISTNVQATTISTVNAQITGGAVSGLASLSATTAQATNFSSGNVAIAGGTASLASLTATGAQIANFNSGNINVTGGLVTGLTTLSAAQSTLANLNSTTAQITNLSTGNAQITGGNITVTNSTVTTETAANFSTSNAQITGGSVTNLTTVTATNGTISTITTANAQITGGNVSGVNGSNNIFVNSSVQNSSATTVNIAVKNESIATTQYVHNLLPIGVIIMYSGNTIPFGWHICDGNAGTPNLVDRFIVGAGGTYGVKATGGNTSVTLTASQMPVHSHSINSVNAVTSGAGAHNHTATSTSAVSDAGHTHSLYTNAGAPWNGAPRGVSANSSGADGDLDGSTRVTGYDKSSVDLNIQLATTGITVATTTTLTPVDIHTHTVTLAGNTSNAGGTTAVDITPSYYALYYIQKVV